MAGVRRALHGPDAGWRVVGAGGRHGGRARAGIDQRQFAHVLAGADGGQQFTVAQQSVDYEATASIGTSNLGVDATENRDRLGDGSPMVSAAPFAPIAIETGYLPADRLGGNS